MIKKKAFIRLKLSFLTFDQIDNKMNNSQFSLVSIIREIVDIFIANKTIRFKQKTKNLLNF